MDIINQTILNIYNCIIDFFKKYLVKYRYCFLYCLFIALIYCLFCDCGFEVNDDYYIKALIMNGNAHVIYQNYVIGYLLVSLYKIIPLIPWYELFQVLVLIISFSAILYVVFNITENKNSLYIALLLNGLLIKETITTLQYTKTSSIATISGYMLLFYYLKKNNNQIIKILSFVLLISGYCIRGSEFALISFFMLLILIFEITSKENLLIYIKKLFTFILLTTFTIVLLTFVNLNSYKGDYSNVLIYDDIRSSVLDNHLPDYYKYKDSYEKLGISDNDYIFALVNWNHDDPELFNSDTLTNISNINKGPNIMPNISDYMNDLVNYCIGKKGIVLVVLLSIVSYFSSNKKIDISTLFYSLSVFIIITALYFYRGIMANRVILGIITAYVYFLMFHNIKEDNKSTNIGLMIIYLIFSAYIVVLPAKEIMFRKTEFEVFNEGNKSIIEQINNDSDHIYFKTPFNNIYVSKLFEVENCLPPKNLVSLGGWLTQYPTNEQAKKEYNAYNPYKDSINNDKVYFLVEEDDTTLMSMIITYISDHYDPGAKPEYLFSIHGYKEYLVYRIVS